MRSLQATEVLAVQGLQGPPGVRAREQTGNGSGRLPAQGFEPEPQASVLFGQGESFLSPSRSRSIAAAAGPGAGRRVGPAHRGGRAFGRSVPAGSCCWGLQARRAPVSCLVWLAPTGRALRQRRHGLRSSRCSSLARAPVLGQPLLAREAPPPACQQGVALQAGFRCSSRSLPSGRAAGPFKRSLSGDAWAPAASAFRAPASSLFKGVSRPRRWPAGVSWSAPRAVWVWLTVPGAGAGLCKLAGQGPLGAAPSSALRAAWRCWWLLPKTGRSCSSAAQLVLHRRRQATRPSPSSSSRSPQSGRPRRGRSCRRSFEAGAALLRLPPVIAPLALQQFAIEGDGAAAAQFASRRCQVLQRPGGPRRT